jgi:hypothetical protein
MNHANDPTEVNEQPMQQEQRGAVTEDLALLLHSDSPAILQEVLNHPALTDVDVCLLLRRKTLPGEIVEAIAQRKAWLKTYAVKKALVSHPHASRLVSLRLMRELYLMDLVQIALSPGVSVEMQHYAEEQLAARLPQLPLGQKITLARRGPRRVAGLLLAEGHPQIIPLALDNARITTAQILKALAREGVSAGVVAAIAQHRHWNREYHVRLALVRNANSTLSSVLSFLPELTVADLRELSAPGIVPERLRKYLQAEVSRRVRGSEKIAQSAEFNSDSRTSNDA